MAAQTELTGFVREALTRGQSRAGVETVLLGAGWSRDVVQAALASYAEVDFPIPVPRPRAYLSAREACLYLLLFAMLYVSAYNAGAVIFEAIDRAFPDPAVRSYAAWNREALRWALSSLIVAFPVFAYLSAVTTRSVTEDPAKRRSNVRRWLMYMTIFAAASALVGDLITLVYNTLGGELTTRFVLKVATIAAIAGTVFGYYLSDLRLDDTRAPGECIRIRRLFGWSGSASAAAVVATGLFMIGPPREERTLRLDEQRVEHLRDLVRAANNYYERQGRLATSLDELTRESRLGVDASTGPYEYRTTGSQTYELCATFERESRGTEAAIAEGFWSHAAGRRCYPLKAKEYK